MIEAPQRPSVATLPPIPAAPIDDRAARRSLQAQVERLERELAGLFASSWPRKDLVLYGGGDSGGVPRIPDLAELERTRDALAGRVQDARRELADRRRVELGYRRLVEEMLRDPSSHRWVRVSHADIGEPGCHHWHVVPRWGLLGRLMNWWRVKVSSGCP